MEWDFDRPIHRIRNAWLRRSVTILLSPLVIILSPIFGALDGCGLAMQTLALWWKGGKT